MKLLLLVLLLSNSITAQYTFPGHSIIGKSYDVFGEFANNKSVISHDIFDFSKMQSYKNGNQQVLPKLVSVENISEHNIRTIEGRTINDYISDLSVNAGFNAKTFFFKTSVDGRFKKNLSESGDAFYYTYMDINKTWRVNLDIRNIDKLINCLDQQFKSDIESLPPKELFELYGTHFIASAYLGSRLDFSTITQTDKTSTINDVKMAVEGQFKRLRNSASIDFSINESNSQTFQNSNTSTTTKITGGDSELAGDLQNNRQYSAWAKSIKQNTVLCDFDQKSLKPIWLLTTNLERRTLLENHYHKVIIPKHPIPNVYKKDPILDNTQLFQNFMITIIGFKIHNDCDLFEGDGEFKYKINLISNGKTIKHLATPQNRIHLLCDGELLKINKEIPVSIPLEKNSKIKVWVYLQENDLLADFTLANHTISHPFPFTPDVLYNSRINGIAIWREFFQSSGDCRASFCYQIRHVYDQTAIDFGNKGWEEFEKGNYDLCLAHSKTALSFDNALAYVHYNIALVYLIQNNPNAYYKYKITANLFYDKEYVEAALTDINEYETKFGPIVNAERIKILLRSKL